MKTTNNKRNFSFTMFLFEAINTKKKISRSKGEIKLIQIVLSK